MPLVFVHGVNVRDGSTDAEKKEFKGQVDARDRLFRTTALAGLVPPPATLHIENPYWGARGVTFSHDLASVPHAGTEAFGPASDDFMAQVLTETLLPSAAEQTIQTSGGENAALLILARQDPERSLVLALDAVVAASAYQPVEGDDLAVASANDALADFAARATRWLASAPDPKWLFAKHPITGQPQLQDDSDFVEALLAQVKGFNGAAGGPEAFGAGGLLARLKNAAAALGQAAKATARAVASAGKGVVGAAIGAIAGAAAAGAPGGSALVKAVRPLATQRAGLFMGDVFTYLDDRGDKDAPGEIVQIVRDALRNAAAKKTTADSKLVVVAHSMGGNIVYDILTHFDPGLHVDLWVTVGSQVAFFKEMRLYVEDKGKPAIPPGAAKAQKPAAVGAWLNVFDPLDVLGFAAEGIFEGVRDFAFSTQANALDAHTMYFFRPSFHERLRVRIVETGVVGP